MSHRRRKVSNAELHAMLTRRFRETAADLCTACQVPKPVFFAGADKTANWRLPPLGECNGLCHTILQDIAENLSQEYELTRPGQP